MNGAASESAQVRRHLCQTRHGYVHVREAGAGGVPLVLLHFTPYSSLAFTAVLPLFARDRLVIAVDRIGFGMSDPASARLEMSDYAIATLDAVRALGVTGEFDLVGIHTGAVEALEIATAHVDAVRQLVLVALPVWTDVERDALQEFTGSFLQEPAADGSHLTAMWRAATAMGDGHYPFGSPVAADPALESDLARRSAWSRELVQGFVLHYLLAGPRWNWIYPAIAGFPSAERLPEVSQPLLFIRTLDDIWEQTGRALELLPSHAERVTMPHLDMAAFATAPGEMVSVITSFLDGG